MKVALVQMNSKDDKKQNINNAIRFVKKAIANKSQFILLPEVFNYRGPSLDSDSIKSIAESIPGESIIPFIGLAKRHNVFILAGSIYEKVKNSSKAFNTSILISNKGEIIAKYRKIHLFNADLGVAAIRETDRFIAGNRCELANIGKFKVGLSICYDLRFPELYRKYSNREVHILCIPSSFTKPTGIAHWEVLLRARAIENLCYVLAPNQIGIDGDGVESYGNSMIIDPWGEITARASGTKEEIIYSYINEEFIKSSKRRLPSLENRKIFSLL